MHHVYLGREERVIASCQEYWKKIKNKLKAEVNGKLPKRHRFTSSSWHQTVLIQLIRWQFFLDKKKGHISMGKHSSDLA